MYICVVSQDSHVVDSQNMSWYLLLKALVSSLKALNASATYVNIVTHFLLRVSNVVSNLNTIAD